ncbi:MAG: hypothetical protein WC510_03785 [Candidatus Omnitrophota bacterium]
MKKNKVRLPVRLISVSALTSVLILLFLWYAAGIARRNPYFTVKEVICNEEDRNINFTYLTGRNIFSIDLGKESRYIAQLYPAYKRVRLVRLLPNRIFVEFSRRQPVACLRLHRYFYIDEEMVLFEPGPEGPASGITLITGLEGGLSKANNGSRCGLKELKAALDIIKESKKDKILSGYPIKMVNLSNPASVSYFISLPQAAGQAAVVPSVLEVRIPQDDIGKRISILAGLFAQLKNDLSSIKYIDMRFKEPAIKFKEEKGEKL